jgi:hypothetical protein
MDYRVLLIKRKVILSASKLWTSIQKNPNPKLSFVRLCEHLKPKGRMAVWVYRRSDKRIRTMAAEELRKHISRLNPTAKDTAIKMLSLPFLLKHLVTKRKLDRNDRLVHIYNVYSHKYASKHTVEEVKD